VRFFFPHLAFFYKGMVNKAWSFVFLSWAEAWLIWLFWLFLFFDIARVCMCARACSVGVGFYARDMGPSGSIAFWLFGKYGKGERNE